MPVKIVHQWPSCQGTAPAPPSAARAALLGENASNSPCAENAARGSSSRLTTYAAMQAAVTTLVKLLRPNSARSGAATPTDEALGGLRAGETTARGTEDGAGRLTEHRFRASPPGCDSLRRARRPDRSNGR